jgi:hypothetical protein
MLALASHSRGCLFSTGVNVTLPDSIPYPSTMLPLSQLLIFLAPQAWGWMMPSISRPPATTYLPPPPSRWYPTTASPLPVGSGIAAAVAGWDTRGLAVAESSSSPVAEEAAVTVGSRVVLRDAGCRSAAPSTKRRRSKPPETRAGIHATSVSRLLEPAAVSTRFAPRRRNAPSPAAAQLLVGGDGGGDRGGA